MARKPTAARPARKTFTLNAGRDMLEFEIQADDFEVADTGVHFIADQGAPTEHVVAFVSHPCIVREDDGSIADARSAEPVKP